MTNKETGNSNGKSKGKGKGKYRGPLLRSRMSAKTDNGNGKDGLYVDTS
jgi:hypothetical protein